MASIPLIVCDPASSWYDFAYPLSWSNNCQVAEILSDIPFISVGILMFGVSALFLVMKRVSISAVWLFFSTLQAFVAAVIDLGQTLAEGMAMNTTFASSEPASRTREVLLALSIGSRFLFYWSYVAEPPRRDLSAVSTAKKVNFLALEWAHKPHSGSSTRWGLPGKLLGVGLLLAIITITVLQIVWRVLPQFHQYSIVYGTDAALELLVSFLLLLRLLLNTLSFNAPDDMIVHTFKECLAPISGLLVNIAIGVGNLLCFAFTESTVGRLLQALEIFILVIFAVVTAFLRHRSTLLSATSSQDRRRRGVFTLPEPARGSTFRVTLPFIETPRMSTILDAATENKELSPEAFRRSARRSLNHVSSWVSSKLPRNRAPQGDEEVRLWNAEKVKVDPLYTSDLATELVRSSVASTQEPRGLEELLRAAPANHLSITSALDSQSAFARSMEDSVYNGQISHPSRSDVLQRRVPSPIPSGANYAGRMADTPEASPVYGLSGIQPPTSPSDSRTSLDELLRQQSQLDQSIEVLKLFSARNPANSSHSDSAMSPGNVDLSRSPSTGQRTVSSEVSLSSFPIPPWLTNPVPPLPSPDPSSVKRIRGSRQTRFAAAQQTPVQDTHASVSLTTSASLVDIPSFPRFNSIPHSPFGDENESLPAEAENGSRSNSSGTQYNVTSFIGGLATPGEARLESQEKSRWPVESESNADTIQNNSGEKKHPPRMLPVPRRFEGLPASHAAARLSPLARSSGNVVDESADFVQYYRTNYQISRPLPVAPSPRTLTTDHAAKWIPSTGPRFARETDPPIAVPAVQRAFVRPRPPPLVIHSYTEQNANISRVQVLADD